MKRNKASLNDDRHSNNDSDDDNAKKPKNEDSAVNENDKVAGPLNCSVVCAGRNISSSAAFGW